MSAAPSPVERVRLAVAEYLDTPESFPLVVRMPRPPKNAIEDAFQKQERRKYLAVPERITAMGELTP